MVVSFDNPWYLLLIPVVALFLFITQKFMFTKDKGRKIGAILARALLFLAVILALSGFTLKFTGRNTTTIYLLDVSDSVRDEKNELVTFVNESVKEKGRRDDVGVIAFGGDTRVEQIISDNLTFSKFQTKVDSGATDLEEAVKMALAQMPEGSAGRIVLVSDGNENEGSLKSMAADVIASGCSFEVKKIEENVSNEVYVSDMSIPNKVGIGENFNIEVEVESNVACDATVKLYSGRTLKGEQEVHLQKGTNEYIFKDTQTAEGLKTYKVVVEAKEDTISVNNEFSSYTNIEVQLPLLIVEGTEGNAFNYTKMLDAMEMDYSVSSPGTVPVDMSTLMQYSAVVFVDVFISDLRDGFLDVLDDYVKNNGRGFIIVGGENSYALGGYRDTVIEDMAPVYMDLRGENEIPSMAMCMVIDHSGSMSWGNGIITNLDLAKEAAASAVGFMRAEDYVEVIAFDDTYSRVVPFTNVDDPEGIQKEIYRIMDGGGTSIYPALEAAVSDINKQDAMIKHIILLTDGEDYNSDYDDLMQIINSAGITLSCVAVGDGCNNTLLEDLALRGNGRIFYTDVDSDLPRIFAQEVFLASNNYLINETFTPVVINSNDKIIKDIVNSSELPELHGYVATTPKERSIELLESFQGDPILSYWQYGLGKTVAWTSDVNGEWSSEYSRWDRTSEMWNNIIKFVSEENGMEGTRAEVEQNGSKATLTYTTNSYSSGSKVTAIVYNDEGEPVEVELDPVKPGIYETTIDTKDTGIYTINVQQKDDGEIVNSLNTAAIMQYSMEYRFYPDNTLLEEFVSSVGGVFIDKPSEVFEHKPDFVKARFNLWIPLLILSLFAFLVDIAVRRFHLSLDFINKQAEKREKKKALREEKKRKEEAEIIKAETAKPVVPKEPVKAPKSDLAKAADMKKQTASTKAKGPVKVYENKNAVTKPVTSSLKPEKSLKPENRQFERTASTPSANAGNVSPSQAMKNLNSSKNSSGTGKVTDSAAKTRVWVRDDK